jgi:cell division protein ZapA
MSDCSITVNGRSYVIACEDGQEAHLARLADYIDKRVTELAESVGQVGENRLILMASLLVADELGDAYAALAAERGEADISLVKRLAGDQAPAADDPTTAQLLELLAERVEALASKLEGAEV